MLYWDSASALYDGGWRSSDREMLRDEYDLSDEQLDLICEILDTLDDRGVYDD